MDFGRQDNPNTNNDRQSLSTPSTRRGGRRVNFNARRNTSKTFALWQIVLLFIVAILCIQLSLSWHVLSNHPNHLYGTTSSSSSSSSSLQTQTQEPQPQWRKMRHDVPDRIDGTFNGAPLQLVSHDHTKSLPSSRIHCVGSNYQYDGSDWMQRSCHFYFLCFNTSNSHYVVFQSTPEQSLTRVLTHSQHFHIATLMSAAPNTSQAVSIGGINQKWGGQNLGRLRWFPDIVNMTNNNTTTTAATTTTTPLTYYALPTSAVLLPYHSLNGANPGHLVWDDFMALYTLLDMFDLLQLEPLLMRYILNDGQRGMWASCDFRDDKRSACRKILEKFSPMLMSTANDYHWSTTQEFDFVVTHAKQPASDLVCATHGAAGLGSLTDHGVKKSHGWEESDYETTHNHGRGGLMRRFRQHVMENLGLGHLSSVPRQGPHRVVVSQSSSSIPARNLKFEFEIELLQKGLADTAMVEPYTFKDLDLTEQLRIAGQTAVYITPCGGGAVTGMFLPPGASIIIYYQHNGGVQNNHGTGLPAMLDWDLFSAMSHLRVHWFPMAARGDYVGQAGLLFLIKHELFLIETLPP